MKKGFLLVWLFIFIATGLSGCKKKKNPRSSEASELKTSDSVDSLSFDKEIETSLDDSATSDNGFSGDLKQGVGDKSKSFAKSRRKSPGVSTKENPFEPTTLKSAVGQKSSSTKSGGVATVVSGQKSKEESKQTKRSQQKEQKKETNQKAEPQNKPATSGAAENASASSAAPKTSNASVPPAASSLKEEEIKRIYDVIKKHEAEKSKEQAQKSEEKLEVKPSSNGENSNAAKDQKQSAKPVSVRVNVQDSPDLLD
jgi:hypothetical protein